MRAIRWGLALAAFVCLIIALAGCQHIAPGHPAAKDVQAMVERKPAPTDDILTPGGSTRYNAEIEAWGDRISSAAGIVCRNLVAQGMAGVKCPSK